MSESTSGKTGHNLAGARLLSFVERVERLREEKKALNEDEKLVMAEAKVDGFVPAGIRYVVKQRAKAPHDREEEAALRDLYMEACGMGDAGPLFRQVGLMDVDIASREAVTEALKALVPANGEIIVKVGGKAVRLWRDEDGKAQSEDYVEPKRRAAPAEANSTVHNRPAAEVPDVDAEGAAELGKAAYTANRPITANPFPFGDKRRGIWDKGWRAGSGTDGMGPMDDGEDEGDGGGE